MAAKTRVIAGREAKVAKLWIALKVKPPRFA